jgi:hypothetical protein
MKVTFRATKPIRELPIRACQCSFCRKHNVRATSDPLGHLTIDVENGERMNRYRFGLGITDFLVCRECGTYCAALMPADPDDANSLLATLIVNVLDLESESVPEPVAAHYGEEDEDGRRERRHQRWMPATLEISNSAV